MSLGITNEEIDQWRIYARISKKEEYEALVSKQLEVLTIFAQDHDLNLTEPFYEDNGFSGRDITRPGYRWMLKDIQEHKDCFGILITRLDRLNRNLHESIHLMNLCWLNDMPICAIHQLCDIFTPEGKFNYQLYSLIAEKESDDISYRTKLALKAKKERAKKGKNNE